MKEFDLEKAKVGAPIMTRDGREARIINERKHPEFPLVVAVCDKDGTEDIYLYTYEGRSYVHQICDEDLVMAPIVHKKYANFYLKYGDFHDLGEVMTQDKIVNLLLKSIPYPDQINNLDLSTSNAVKFEYRGISFRIHEDLSVEEREGAFLSTTVAAIFLEKLIKDRHKYYED